MGHHSYSSVTRSARSEKLGYATKSAQEIFTARSMNNAMDPNGVTLRESRDSAEHPDSVPIILALDVTGSMGSIPHFLVKEGLPHMMEKIMAGGVKDPQVLFMGIGDHECGDRAPLQIGQFESGDGELDHWLTTIYLEGGGGGNDGESYHLAWMFGGRYTAHDRMDKRKKKGILFTIGDEHVLPNIPAHAQQKIMGPGQYSDTTNTELLDRARKLYDVYHLHLKQGTNGMRQDVQDGWKQLLGSDNVVLVERREDVAQFIADKVLEVMGGQGGQQNIPEPVTEGSDGGDDPMML